MNTILLHYRHWPDVQPALDAILEQVRVPQSVYVVDNASRDGSLEKIRAHYPMVSVIELDENRGYAAGMNAGLQRTPRSPTTLLLTHDCVLAPRAVETLSARLGADESLGAVGPLTAFLSDPETVFSAGGRFGTRSRRPYHDGWRQQLEAFRGTPPRAVEWITGSCALVRRAMFDAIGPFDEGYFMYFEETELFARAVRAGWRLECVPDALAWQEPGPRPVALWTRNELRFLYRNFGVVPFARQLGIDLKVVARGLVARDPSRRQGARLVAAGLAGALAGVRPDRLYALGRDE